MYIYSAPLEGVTAAPWRRAHAAVFGGVDKYFAPFFSPTREHVIPPRVRRELLSANNPGLRLVPQLLCRDADDFIWAARELSGMGFGEVNFNLGCPSGTVTAKGKGSGLLSRPDELDAFFERVFSALDGVKISVKTRLGVEEPEEFGRLLEIFARYPICELSVHARLRRDMYRGRPRVECFAGALGRFPGPLCYNGDIFSPAAAERAAGRFPGLHGLMLGRGLAANPALAREIRGGARPSRAELERFHALIFEGCARDFGAAGAAVPRMKELWSYLICLFEPCKQLYKQLAKSKSAGGYLAAAQAILSGVPLAPGAYFEGVR